MEISDRRNAEKVPDLIEMNQPIQVVMFGSGPDLNLDAKQFLCRLEEHPEIEFLGAFCQAQSQSLRAVFTDLWKRRSWLAFPLFVVWITNKTMHFLLHPREEIALHRSLEKIADRIHFVTNIHAQSVLEQVRALNPDLGLIYGSPILKPVLFEIPRLGTLGIHHGKVPEYRGNKTTFWAMYNGERVAGVTIQKVNRGLDTGNIVKSGEVSTQDRAYRSVVRELEKLGLDLYLQAILEVKHGTAEYRPQSGVKGKLYRNPKPGDFLKFWGRQIGRRVGIAK
jgi:folate-dependent phosphoribosylglycinamide formyltransferase PurN